MVAPPRRASAYQRILSDHEGQLQTWLREFDRSGALPEAHAAVDNAYALGHAAGLETGRAEHLDGIRTLLLNLLEMKFGELDDGALLDRIDEAQLPRLQRWILAAVSAESVADVISN
jgi:hypothetical protein